jgi:hypothetical protein
VKFTWSLMLRVLVSPGPRFEAKVKNATVRPSPLIAGSVPTSLDTTVVSVVSHNDRLACAGRTYALPSARWELLLTCRPGNNALPA